MTLPPTPPIVPLVIVPGILAVMPTAPPPAPPSPSAGTELKGPPQHRVLASARPTSVASAKTEPVAVARSIDWPELPHGDRNGNTNTWARRSSTRGTHRPSEVC